MFNLSMEISQFLVLLLSLPAYFAYKKIGVFKFKHSISKKYFPIQVINSINVNYQKIIFADKKYLANDLKAVYLFQTIGYDYNMAEREILWPEHKKTVLAYNEYGFNGCNYALVNINSDYWQMTQNDIFILEERFNGLIYVVVKSESNPAIMNIIFPKYDENNFGKAVILDTEISHFLFKGKVSAFIKKKTFI
jgi:hypothetical protein